MMMLGSVCSHFEMRVLRHDADVFRGGPGYVGWSLRVREQPLSLVVASTSHVGGGVFLG
jgi:hypothetical protein